MNLLILELSLNNRDFNKNVKSLHDVFHKLEHNFMDIFYMNYLKNTFFTYRKNSKNTLFKKIKVILEEKW